mmetsp:Transcript_10363/g.15942  ORF Transcript_10363/g.15942 Transcript_10363/m.15942 type:complete len:90 (+) Transcript_10363:279-548(+)
MSLHGLNDVSELQQATCESLKTSFDNLETSRPSNLKESRVLSIPSLWKNSTQVSDVPWMEETKYSIANLNASSMPVVVRFGACLPASCN